MENNTNEGSVNAGEGQAKPADPSELQAQLEQLQKSNQRLLSESKDYKQKYAAVKSEIESREQSSALEKGDYKKIAESERAKALELSTQLENMKQKVLKQAVRVTVGKFAQDVHDIEDVLNQNHLSHILKEGIDLEELTMSEDKAKEFVAAVLTEKPWLKKSPNQAGAMTKKPGAGISQPKKPSEMTLEETIQALKSLGN